MGQDIMESFINGTKILVIFLSMVGLVPLLVWAERRTLALMQSRLGPNRTGPLGLLQILADLVKPLMKEDFAGQATHKGLFYLAPLLAIVPPALVFGAIPFSHPLMLPSFEFLGYTFGPYTFYFQGFNLNVGVVFALGITSLSAYALLIAGWSSGNKYSLLGALRAAAQTISYELGLSLALVGLILVFNTLDFLEMVKIQSGPLTFSFFGSEKTISFLPGWGIFYQPVGAFLLFISFLAESNRIPFDLPEAEGELVAGYHTEYGGIKLILFYIGEYAHIMVASALMVTFYFGGYTFYPFLTEDSLNGLFQTRMGEWAGLLTSMALFITFLIKFFLFIFVFMWIRATLPRFRYDQLMDLGWKTLLPWAFGNAVITALVIFIFDLFKRGSFFG